MARRACRRGQATLGQLSRAGEVAAEPGAAGRHAVADRQQRMTGTDRRDGLLGPRGDLRHHPVLGIVGECGDQAQREIRVVVEGPGVGGPQLVEAGGDRVGGGRDVRTGKPQPPHQVDVVGRVRQLGRVRLTSLREPVMAVGAQGLQHGVPAGRAARVGGG